jgi:hypothetical protein
MRRFGFCCGVALTTAVMACGATNSGEDGIGGDGADDGVASEPTATSAGSADSAPGETGGGSADGATNNPSGADTNADDDTAGPGIPVNFDVGGIPDAGAGFCQPGGKGSEREPLFSYLWACNSTQGTISKIDTQTITEVGRYYTRPDLSGSPSRTSVSLSGNVVVANRSGGLTKIYATTDQCVESNGIPGIQTSTDANMLPWDQEECRAWHLPFDYDSQRPVAWAPGDWNSATCEWENERLWSAGRWGQVDTEVVLIDGEAGVVLDQVNIPGLKPDQFGLYGAAVDASGDLWTTGWATGNHLVHVDIDTMAVQIWDGPSITGSSSHWYGMTVDVDGFVWNCASRAARFDPASETWTVSPELPAWGAGCMADADPMGLLWMGTGNSVTAIDRDTFAVVHTWPVPSSYGVSIDFYGYVWAVNGSGAHRVEPNTGVVTSYNGLTGAYTYSDMTGFALSTVGGGGQPSG